MIKKLLYVYIFPARFDVIGSCVLGFFLDNIFIWTISARFDVFGAGFCSEVTARSIPVESGTSSSPLSVLHCFCCRVEHDLAGEVVGEFGVVVVPSNSSP